MKTQIVGFILFLCFCALVPLGVTAPSPYTVSYSGPSNIPAGGSGTFTFTVRKDGIPQSGVTVYIYRRPETDSYLTNDTPVTDANGQVQTTLRLDSTASGTYRITGSAPDREGGKEIDERIDYVRFDVTVVNSPPPPPPPEPSTLVKISAGNQIAAPGDSVTLVVKLQDSDGNPISGVGLDFVLFGDDATGSRSPQRGTTGADGRAQTTLTLSSNAEGEYRVEAHRSDDFSVAVHFTVTVDTSLPPPQQQGDQQQTPQEPVTTLPLPEPTGLGSISGGNQERVTGEVLANPFVIEVRDQYDKPIAGVTATFALLTGGGSLSATTATTDENGRAESTLTLGSAPGTNTVEASVEGISRTEVFSAEANLPPPVATVLSIVSGHNQNGLTGEALANPYVVEVRDQYDAPLAGVTVTFALLTGGGSLSATTATTDENGRAESTLTLGSAPGTNTVEASVEGISRTEVFSAEANLPPPVATALSIVSGDIQTGFTGEALASAFVVEVRDQYDATMAGVTVTFALLTGGGSLSATTATTDENGRAESTLTLGSEPGTNTVEASVEGISRREVFSAEASLPPPVATSLSIVSGDNQEELTGETLANPFVIEVRDQYDAPLAGVTVTFALPTGGGSLSSEMVMTDANGRAESTLTLGSEPGTNTVEVSVEGISQMAVFSAEAGLPPPVATALSIVSGHNQNGLTGEALANPFVIGVRDQYDAPLAGVTVTFALLTGGGSLSATTATTDANGRAESTLTLGSAPGTNTVEASVEGISRREVFSAEASLPPPVATSLSIVSGDNQEELTGETLANPFVIEVRDQYDAPLAGVTVTFALPTGGGSLSSEMVMTDANGRAESTLTLGSEPGTNSVEVSVEGITEAAIFIAVAKLLEFDLSVPSRISLIHVPLKVRSVDGVAGVIESVGDLYDVLGGDATVRYLITYNEDTQQWNSYLGDESRGDPEDRVLADELGIVANMKTPVSVRLGGDALGADGMSSIELNQGINLVGLPLKDSRIMRVSDLLALEGIAGNVPTITVSDDRRFKTVGRMGDDGDIPVTGGLAFFLIAGEAATIDISGEGWSNSPVVAAAPPMARAGVEVSDATPVLALTGSIAVDGTGLTKASVHVTVKNLRTGKSVTTAMANRGYRDVDYQITTVDMGTGQAARIGDVLEISAQSTALSIRFHPVRHIVTSEDVERSRIHLPELIAYEIPAKTQLLSNYPNPFNPETWIPYGLSNDTDVQIAIYDISGGLVRQLDLGHQRAGHYTQRSRAAYWDGRNGIGEHVASGVYFYTLTADDFTATRKMLIGK